jgi:hypothetical protein
MLALRASRPLDVSIGEVTSKAAILSLDHSVNLALADWANHLFRQLLQPRPARLQFITFVTQPLEDAGSLSLEGFSSLTPGV